MPAAARVELPQGAPPRISSGSSNNQPSPISPENQPPTSQSLRLKNSQDRARTQNGMAGRNVNSLGTLDRAQTQNGMTAGNRTSLAPSPRRSVIPPQSIKKQTITKLDLGKAIKGKGQRS